MATKGGIGNWMASLSPEEKADHYRKLKEKQSEARRKKREFKLSVTEKAREMLPELLAQEMLSEKEWKPSDALLANLRELVGKGYTVEEMRKGPLKHLDSKSWDSLTRSLFKDHVGEIANMGLTLLDSKKKALKRLSVRARMIRREMKKIKTAGKIISPKYFSELGSVENELHAIEVELAKTFYQIEAVGEKAKNGSIILNFGTPRPVKPEDKAIDVTPT